MRTGVTANLTGATSPATSPDTLGGDLQEPLYQKAVAWTRDDHLILCDEYDLWLVDVSGRAAPRNLTRGYGKAHHTQLRYVDVPDSETNREAWWVSLPTVSIGTSLLLAAFDDTTKRNGFFRQPISEPSDPLPLTMLPEVISPPEGRGFVQFGFLLKASHANTTVVKRMSAKEYPNLYATEDFKTYRKLTDLRPQEKYNWYTSELVHWTTYDGRPGEGVIYKPEDFDPSKKYPVIVHYYEQLSPSLNVFWPPDADERNVEPSWYASHGYVVFCPDIHYVVGKVADSVYNYVASGAQWISQQPWADAARIGAQGYSFGGFETNLLITRTHLFAAAATGGGFSDLVASYLGNNGPLEGPAFTEFAQVRMGEGAMPWSHVAEYVANSPVLNAGKISVPLLILQNSRDRFNQGYELFAALVRQNKPVWLVSYPDEGHGLSGAARGEDFLIRMNQFFDHYLKNAPPPTWMTQGIPARLEGIETGLELDMSGAVP